MMSNDLLLGKIKNLDIYKFSLVNFYNYIVYDLKIEDEKILFSSSILLKKKSSEIQDFYYDYKTEKFIIVVNTYIFFGESGIIPDFINEFMIHDKEKYFQDFLDIFNDKIIKIYIKSVNSATFFYNHKLFSKIFNVFSSRANNNIVFLNNLGSIFYDFSSSVTITKILRNFLKVDVEIDKRVGEETNLSVFEEKKLGKNLKLDDDIYIGNHFWNHYKCLKIVLIIKNESELNYVLKDNIKGKIVEILNIYFNNLLHFQIRTRLLFNRKSYLNLKSNVPLLGINTVLHAKKFSKPIQLYYLN